MTYELLREINVVLAGVASAWLGYRTVRAWPAEWAKPHHVGHYRALLIVQVVTFAVLCYGSSWHEERSSDAGPPSLLVTIVALVALAICWRWPKPTAWESPS